jgi:hypothetical protein
MQLAGVGVSSAGRRTRSTGPASCGGQGPIAADADGGHRWPYPARLVPPERLGASSREGWNDIPCQGPRSASCACVMAAGWRCRPAGSQRTARAQQHLHHGEVSAHPSRRGRHRARCVREDPQPGRGRVSVNPRGRWVIGWARRAWAATAPGWEADADALGSGERARGVRAPVMPGNRFVRCWLLSRLLLAAAPRP